MEHNIRKKLQEENIDYYSADSNITFSSAILEAVKLIPDTATRVLDVGCGIGTAKLLADKLKPGIEEFHGLEFHQSAVPLARQNLKYFREADIESIADNAFPENYFDVIMFNDVLEHLVFPELTLRRFLRFMKNDGCLVTSIPNAGHQSVVLNIILNGLWTDDCIALKEHLHFYTLAEIIALLKSFELHIQEDITGICSEPDPAMRAILKAARPWMKIPFKQAVTETNIVQYVLRAGYKQNTDGWQLKQVANILHRLE